MRKKKSPKIPQDTRKLKSVLMVAVNNIVDSRPQANASQIQIGKFHTSLKKIWTIDVKHL